MVKLVPAICPQCGAQLKVNPGDEQIDCQFCGTTIMIDEAVEKYQLEIVHKIKVDGIRGRDDFYEQAEKHFKAKEYYDAISILVGLVENDKFDIEAYILFIKCNCEILKSHDYNPILSAYSNDYAEDDLHCFSDLIDYYERVQKIDKEKKYEKELKKYIPYIDDLSKQVSDAVEQNNRADEYIEIMEDDRRRADSYNIPDEYHKIVEEAFKLSGALDIIENDDGKPYYLGEFVDLTADGYIIGSYYLGITTYNKSEHQNATIPVKTICTKAGELDERYNEYRKKVDELFAKADEEYEKQDKKDLAKANIKIVLGLLLILFNIGLTVLVVWLFITDPDWPDSAIPHVLGVMALDFILRLVNIFPIRRMIMDNLRLRKVIKEDMKGTK